LIKYRDGAGKPRVLEPGCLVPLPYSGRIVRIVPDYLAETVFIRHEIEDVRGRCLYTAFGHVTPASDLKLNSQHYVATPIARIAPQKKKSPLPPHLHVSFIWLPPDYPLDRLDWPELEGAEEAEFVEPLLAPQDSTTY